MTLSIFPAGRFESHLLRRGGGECESRRPRREVPRDSDPQLLNVGSFSCRIKHSLHQTRYSGQIGELTNRIITCKDQVSPSLCVGPSLDRQSR